MLGTAKDSSYVEVIVTVRVGAPEELDVDTAAVRAVEVVK